MFSKIQKNQLHLPQKVKKDKIQPRFSTTKAESIRCYVLQSISTAFSPT